MSKVDELKKKIVHESEFCTSAKVNWLIDSLDDLIFAVREECAETLRECPKCGAQQEILWSCEHCGTRCAADAYSFEAAAREI